MKSERSRREFLQDVSLAGAALVAGGSALAAAGCKKNTPEETCPSGKKKVCAYWDEAGKFLFIEDHDIAAKLKADYNQQKANNENEPTDHNTLGIRVVWPDPGNEEHKMNSLCSC